MVQSRRQADFGSRPWNGCLSRLPRSNAKQFFTINEFASFVEGGRQAPIGGASRCTWRALGTILTDAELKPVRHHAVLGHAWGPGDPHKSAGGNEGRVRENTRVAVPIIHTASTPLTPRFSPLARRIRALLPGECIS